MTSPVDVTLSHRCAPLIDSPVHLLLKVAAGRLDSVSCLTGDKPQKVSSHKAFLQLIQKHKFVLSPPGMMGGQCLRGCEQG